MNGKNKTTPYKYAREDLHLANMIRRCREELQENKPVLAHMWLLKIETYINEECYVQD